MSTRLSVVMPAHNEAPYLPATIDALVAALAPGNFDADAIPPEDLAVLRRCARFLRRLKEIGVT